MINQKANVVVVVVVVFFFCFVLIFVLFFFCFVLFCFLVIQISIAKSNVQTMKIDKILVNKHHNR